MVSQDSGSDGNLEGISAVDANTAWAVGERGIILKTSDGGVTWLQQNSPTMSRFVFEMIVLHSYPLF